MTDKRYNPNNTETHRQCADCGAVKERSEFPIARGNHDGTFPYCKPCTRARNQATYQRNKVERKRKRNAIKQELIDSMGGCCSKCGYNQYLAALDFHHEGGNKEAMVSKFITEASTASAGRREAKLAEMRAEAAKCIVLCSNCHKAYHAGEW